MGKTAVAIRHIHFEDLGSLESALQGAGYALQYRDVGVDDLKAIDPIKPDLLVVLGGPIGVYEDAPYPVLAEERTILAARLRANRPTLGLCLGAQLMADVLGAKVGPMGHKEIGFSPLSLTQAGREGPLRHLEGLHVLHWHGDAFQIPEGVVSLATTPLCATQGFALGSNILGLQFHPEVDAPGSIERWLIGHASELATAGIDPVKIRNDAVHYGPALQVGANKMMTDWLAGLTL